MSNTFGFVNKSNLIKINKKREMRNFRKMMGDLEKEFKQGEAQSKNKDLRINLNNPQEIFSKKNVSELEQKLNQDWNYEKRFTDTNGEADDDLYSAPTNDIASIREANTNALKFNNQLNPDPTLVAQQTTADRLKNLRDNRIKRGRERNRLNKLGPVR